MSDFVIAGIGRSGTTWLARTLDLSPSHDVYHEEAESDKSEFQRPFPIERWERSSEFYRGECHGYVLRSVMPGRPGPESRLKRYCLFRDRKDIIRSWMNRGGKWRDSEANLPWVCYAVIKQEAILRALVRDGWRPLQLETLDVHALAAELGAETPSPLPAITKNRCSSYPWDWDENRNAIYEAVLERFRRPGMT